jgi:hypothetical protein
MRTDHLGDSRLNRIKMYVIEIVYEGMDSLYFIQCGDFWPDDDQFFK